MGEHSRTYDRSDNRAARRRDAQRAMRAMLERFAAINPTMPRAGDELESDRCVHCALVFPTPISGTPAWRDPSQHRSNCLWRNVVEWLAQHSQGARR